MAEDWESPPTQAEMESAQWAPPTEEEIRRARPAAKPKGRWDEFLATAKAAGRGALQGATLDFGDEIQGGMGRLMQAEVNLLPEKLKDALRRHGIDLVNADTSDAYRYVRNADRLANAQAQAEHGDAYTVGNLAGAAATAPLLPGGAAKTLGGMMKAGAIMGAASGLGSSEAELGDGEYGRAALDTGVGGLVGAGAGALGFGIGKGGEWLGKKLIQKGATRAAAAESKAAALAEALTQKENQTLMSEAGRSAQAAYKPALELRYAGKLGTLPEAERAAAERLLAEYDKKAAEGLLANEAAKMSTSEALSKALSGAAETNAARAQEMLKPAAGRSAKELFKMYGEPLVATAAGNFLGRKLDDATGMHGLGQALGTAGGLVFGRTRAGKALADRLARPGTQMALANALRRAGGAMGGLGRFTATAEERLVPAPSTVNAIEGWLASRPSLAGVFEPPPTDEEKRLALLEALRGDAP